MPNTHRLTFAYRSEGGTVTVSQKEVSVGKSENVEETIPVGSTNLQVKVESGALARVKGFALGTRRTNTGDSGITSLSVYTNDLGTGAPDDTFLITPTNGVGWATGDPLASPLTADITTLYVTNTGTVDADLIVRIGIDPTATI